MIETVAPATKKLWTEAELQALPKDGYTYEVVDGELVMSPKNNFVHGAICVKLLTALNNHVMAHRLGVVLESNTGFWMQNRNCRAPDVSFISKERLKRAGFRWHTQQFFPGAPDLAVEVLSPNNIRPEIDQRLRDYFGSGAQLVWVIDPQNECVEICESLTSRTLIGSGGFLEGKQVLPGFRYPIADLFKDWDWQ